MISAARQRYIGSENAKFLCGTVPEVVADFTVASGIFNAKLDAISVGLTSYDEIAIADLTFCSKLIGEMIIIIPSLLRFFCVGCLSRNIQRSSNFLAKLKQILNIT